MKLRGGIRVFQKTLEKEYRVVEHQDNGIVIVESDDKTLYMFPFSTLKVCGKVSIIINKEGYDLMDEILFDHVEPRNPQVGDTVKISVRTGIGNFTEVGSIKVTNGKAYRVLQALLTTKNFDFDSGH